MRTCGPPTRPEVPGRSRVYSAGGDEIGMHSVMPYDGSTKHASPYVARIESAT